MNGSLALVVAGVMIAAAAVPAEAAPLATAHADVNGDGTADNLTVEADGRVVIALAGVTGAQSVASADLEAPEKLGAAQVSVEEIDGHEIVIARATLAASTKGDPWSGTLAAGAFEWDAGALAPIWRGLVGPQGQDGEWSVALEVVDGKLMLYEERPDVTACDGASPWLNQRALDVSKKRFGRVSLPPVRPAGAAVLTPQQNAPAGLSATTRPSVFRFQAATTQAGDGGNAEGLAAPIELDDGDAKTAWAEGLGGAGRGELLIARGASARYDVLAVRVIPGDAASTAAYSASNRLKKVVLTVGANSYLVEWPSDSAPSKNPAQPWWIILPKPVKAGCVSVAIDEVYSAKKGEYGRTAISELTVLTEVEAGGAQALAALAEQIATRAEGWEDARHQLSGSGAAGAQAAIGALAKNGRTPDEVRRLRELLTEIDDPAAARALIAALREADEKERPSYEKALTRQAGVVVAELATLVADTSAGGGARAAAARILGGVSDPQARAALVGLCGTGDRRLRTAVGDALGGRDVGELAKALDEARASHEHDPSIGCEADRWRVVARLARRGGDSAARTAAATAASTLLTETTEYELRYRLLQALGALMPEPEAAKAIDSALRTDKDPALRVVAVEAVGARITPELFAVAIADTDPGVRVAALVGAMGAGQGIDPSTDPAVLDRLAKDLWPAVRQASARALVCGRTGVSKALLAAVGSDDSDDVRRTALEKLVSCKETGLGSKLIELARDRNLSAGLRAFATRQIPVAGGPKMVDEAISLFNDARNNSIGDEDNMQVAEAAAYTLGQLKDARATKVLLEAAQDPMFAPIQAAALGALGELCPAGMGPAVAAGLASDEAFVVRAAKLAQKKCKK